MELKDVAGERMRLTVESEYRERLRDYFLRLGYDVRIDAVGTLEVAATGDDELEHFLARWVTANGVTVSPAPAPTTGSADAARPAVTLLKTGDGSRPPLRVGDLLASKGLISQEQLTLALQESRTTGELVGQVLLRKRWVFEDELARTLAEQWSIPYLNLLSVGVDWGAARMLSADVGRRVVAIPVRYLGAGVQVAFADPSDETAVATVQEHVGALTLAVAELSHIELLWARAKA